MLLRYHDYVINCVTSNKPAIIYTTPLDNAELNMTYTVLIVKQAMTGYLCWIARRCRYINSLIKSYMMEVRKVAIATIKNSKVILADMNTNAIVCNAMEFIVFILCNGLCLVLRLKFITPVRIV